jgi:hypothetical protein
VKTRLGRVPCVLFLVGLLIPSAPLCAQAVEDDAIGFGDLKLGASILELPIACQDATVCEDTYETIRVRVWHMDALVRRVDVVYSGIETRSGAEIKSTPISLPQAIRAHSIRFGRITPRLGFAANEGSSRIIVDFANGIAYLAAAVSETSVVTEVRYLPLTDPLVQKASARPLFRHGVWLIEAALSHPRYKNLLAEAETSRPAANTPETTHDEIASRPPTHPL